MNYELKDWLNSINFNKENLIEEYPESIKSYKPFVINKCLSSYMDCIYYVNEMNRFHDTPKDMQYYFYLNSLRKRKRFSSRFQKDKIENLEYVKKYYGYNNEKASQALKILTKEQIDFIKQRLDIGGIR